MNKRIITSLLIAGLTSGAFAASSLSQSLVAENGSERTSIQRVAEDGADRIGASRLAENGAERTLNRVV